MEQIIDTFGIDWKIFSAEILNFLILLAILSYFFYTKIFSVIEERQEKIEDGLRKSEEASEILNDAEEDSRKIIQEAREEANEKINFAVEKGKKKKEDIISKAKNESEKIISNTRKNAQEEKEKIISSSKDEIAKMVVLGAEKILSNK